MLSESVSKALKLTGGPEAVETAKFVEMFDKYFDTYPITQPESMKESPSVIHIALLMTFASRYETT